MIGRREFLARGARLLGVAALGTVSRACRAPRQEAGTSEDASGASDADGSASPREFPLLDVTGEPRAIGLAIGRRFKSEIRAAMDRRRDWFDGLAGFARNEGRAAFEQMIRAARERAPAAYEEAWGIAEGAGLAFEEEILVLNCRSELEAARKTPGACAGCSTIVVADGSRILVAHNEDGDAANSDLMFLLRARPPGGVRFLALCYPGIVAGNAPAINDRGIVMTTNYIGTVAWRAGIPRYFLDRMALEAKTVDDAVRIATDPDRAYSFHHVIAGGRGGRLRAVSVEATPTRSEVRELSGAYVHTNHLILESTRDEPQEREYVVKSSMPRFEAVTAGLERVADPADLAPADLARILSSHAGRPFSPCRHPEGEIRGTTLACAVFDVGRRRERLYRGNPCLDVFVEYDAPEATGVA